MALTPNDISYYNVERYVTRLYACASNRVCPLSHEGPLGCPTISSHTAVSAPHSFDSVCTRSTRCVVSGYDVRTALHQPVGHSGYA